MKTIILGTIGKCIYCNSIYNLQDEHIVPYGLGGPWVLKKASCKECANLTSRLELDVLRKTFITLRASQKMPTRRSLPTNFNVEAKSNANFGDSTISISPEEQLVNSLLLV